MNSNIAAKKNAVLLELSNDILKIFKKENIEIRIIGGIGINLKCPDYQKYFDKYREPFSDIDLIIRKTKVDAVEKIFEQMGYEQDLKFKIHFGYQRRVFYSPQNISIEIYLENLNLCQQLIIGDRLLLNYPTLSATDLFLSKIQKIGLTEKDVFDIYCLLSQHKLSYEEDGNINLEYISNLCAKNWRWWKTLKFNLNEMKNKQLNYFQESNDIDIKLNKIEHEIDSIRKSIFWNLRNIIGEKVSWYSFIE